MIRNVVIAAAIVVLCGDARAATELESFQILTSDPEQEIFSWIGPPAWPGPSAETGATPAGIRAAEPARPGTRAT